MPNHDIDYGTNRTPVRWRRTHDRWVPPGGGIIIGCVLGLVIWALILRGLGLL